jgi:Nif-specific regulatory protein
LKVNVRFVFATNKNLEEAVDKGEFRADLYYRISVVRCSCRRCVSVGDVSLLARNFIETFNSENDQARTRRRHRDAATLLLPGTRARTGKLRAPHGTARDKPSSITISPPANASALLWTSSASGRLSACASRTGRDARLSPLEEIASASRGAAASAPTFDKETSSRLGAAGGGEGDGFASSRKMIDRERLIEGMEKAAWVQAKAARLLGLSLRQVNYALKKYNIEIKRI